MRRQKVEPFQYTDDLTPYDVMRLQNTKPFRFRRDEIYPSIRPPVSQCCRGETAEWLADAMEVSGLERPIWIHKPPECPYDENTNQNQPKTIENRFEAVCRSRRRPRKEFRLTGAQRALDWNKMTPTDLMRMQNCRSFDFQSCEKYPSIRPPVSPCNPLLTAEWLADTVESSGCPRLFDMEVDDIVEVWKRSPAKESLSFYGVGAGIQRPEAIEFNQVVSKCLDMVNTAKPKVEMVQRPPPRNEPPIQLKMPTKPPRGDFVLNRQLLESKITRMPTVQKKLDPSTAFSWLHAPRPRPRPEHPFVADPPGVGLRKALDMEQPPRKEKHGLRRKHPYCELQCGILENKCTEYEWLKYKEDPRAYEEAFKREMEAMENKVPPEPRNYDELYKELVSCFQKTRRKDPIKKAFIECCDADSLFGGAGGAGDKDGKGKGRGDGDDDDDSWNSADYRNNEEELGGEEEGNKDGDGDGAGDGEGGGKKKGGKGKGGKGGKGKGDKDDGKGDGKGDFGKPSGSQDRHTDKVQTAYPPSGGSRLGSSTSLTPKSSRAKDKGKGKKGGRGKGKKGGRGAGDGGECVKDCPCDICKFMTRRELEPDSPLIRQLKREEKRRELRDYLKIMCHRQYIRNKCPEYPAPAHKCDPIDCDNCFCKNPKLGEYCDCLAAMQKLQKLLGPKHRIVNNELLFNVRNLKDRICRRFCECL